MKINKYIVIVAIVASFMSCTQDAEIPVATQTSNIQIVVEPFSATALDIIGQVGSNTAEVDLGFRLTGFSTTYLGSDVVITYQGQDYTIHPEDADGDGIIDPSSKEVIVGPTPVDFEIAPLSGAVPYNGAVISSLIEFSSRYDITVMNRPADLVVLKGGDLSVNARVYGQLPAAEAGKVNFLFDWNPNNDAGNDLDLRLRRMPGDIGIEYSGSISNYEDVSLFDSDMDGMYQVKADAWSTIGGTISGILFAMHPDGTLEVFETDLTGITSGGVSEEVVLVNIDKVTDANGNVTYTLYQ